MNNTFYNDQGRSRWVSDMWAKIHKRWMVDLQEGRSGKRKQISSFPSESLIGMFEGHLRSLGVWVRVSTAEGPRSQDGGDGGQVTQALVGR